MGALFIANYDVDDREAWRAYTRAAGEVLVDGFGGRVVAFTTETVDVGETPTPAGRVTVAIGYPTMEDARAAYESDAYQPLVPRRLAATTPRLVALVPTLDGD